MRPLEELPQWRGSSRNLDSAPVGTPELSVCRAWRLRGGAADLLSSGQERPRCPGPSRPLPVPGGGRILGCVPAPCAPDPALVDSRSRSAQPPPRSRPRAPPSRSRPAAPSAEPHPSPLELLRVPPCALQPLGSSAHSPGAQVSVSVPGSPRASPPSWVLLQLPASPFPLGKVGAAPAPPGRGSPVLGTLAPASAWLLAGPLPLGGLLCLSFFFPVFLPG